MNFSNILKKGKKRFEVKNKQQNKWGRCEACDKRELLFPYASSKNDTWMLCSECLEAFVKDEK